MAIYPMKPALTYMLIFLSGRHHNWPDRRAPLVDEERRPGAIISSSAFILCGCKNELMFQLERSVAIPVVARMFMRCQEYVHLIVQRYELPVEKD